MGRAASHTASFMRDQKALHGSLPLAAMFMRITTLVCRLHWLCCNFCWASTSDRIWVMRDSAFQLLAARLTCKCRVGIVSSQPGSFGFLIKTCTSTASLISHLVPAICAMPPHAVVLEDERYILLWCPCLGKHRNQHKACDHTITCLEIVLL